MTLHNSFENIAQNHYENFPVGSLFVPKKYRKPIHLIYAFARVADDIADEGQMPATERLAKIDEWQRSLKNSLNGNSDERFFSELVSVIHVYKLTSGHLEDLLVAFRRDSTNASYENFEEILWYCKYSANPIGRLLLQIFESSNDETERLSDNICTALQLTNFLQDISVDTGRNRFYIPLSDMDAFGVKKEDLYTDENKEAFCALIKMQVARTEALFQNGKPLIDMVSKDLRFELAVIWHGGMRILEKIKLQNFDTRKSRPSLNLLDKARIFFRAVHL